MLREAGNVDDIVAYQARRATDPSLPPLPDLLVIVDEFAELLAARPEFIDLFVGLGRVGRSLGIHLLLSSQRLDEGRLRGLESHLRYRICLRTYSAVESKLVLGTPDAYLLPSLPGLGYLKVDTRPTSSSAPRLVDAPRRRRTGRRAAPVQVFDAVAPADAARRRRPRPTTTGRERAAAARRPPRRGARARPPGVGRAAAGGRAARRRARRRRRSGGARAPPGLRATLGRLDRPAEQRTEPLDARPHRRRRARRDRRRAAHGQEHRAAHARRVADPAPRPARACSSTRSTSAAGARARSPTRRTPAASPASSTARRSRAWSRQLRDGDRGARGALPRARLGGHARGARRRATACPTSCCMVDGWETFQREFEGLDRQLEELAAAGLSFGVHVVVGANRWAEIRPALLDNLGTRLELRLNDAIDSLVSRPRPRRCPADVAGRGLTTAGRHVPGRAAARRRAGDGGGRGRGARADRRARPPSSGTGRGREPIRLLPRAADARGRCRGAARRRIAIGVEERGAGAGAARPARRVTRTCSSSATPRPASRRCCARSPRPGRRARPGRAAPARSSTCGARSPTSPSCRTSRLRGERRWRRGEAAHALARRAHAAAAGRRSAAGAGARPAPRRALRRLRPQRRADRRPARAAARPARRSAATSACTSC